MEKALEYQKNPPAAVQNASPIKSTPSWMDNAKSLVNQNAPTTSSSQVKKKLGEVLIELKIINQDELDNALTIQKWFKNLIDHA